VVFLTSTATSHSLPLRSASTLATTPSTAGWVVTENTTSGVVLQPQHKIDRIDTFKSERNLLTTAKFSLLPTKVIKKGEAAPFFLKYFSRVTFYHSRNAFLAKFGITL
jgi:hypothetical protein